MKNLRKILVITLAAAAILLIGCESQVTNTSTPDLISTNASGLISPLEEISFDWGDINIMGGDVAKTFKFKNEGDQDLIIKSAITSCMCTTAQVNLFDGSQSPLFGMHSKTPWGGVVKPGEEFEIEVVFDPLAHGPDAVGPIQRSIYIETSSEINGDYAIDDPEFDSVVTELKVKGDVVYDVAAFFFQETEYDFGLIKQSGGIVSYDFEFEYLGDEPIEVTATPTSCACTSAKISKTNFEKGDKGILTVDFDPNLHAEPEGRFFKTVSILTNPSLEEEPEAKIWVEIDLDLGPEFFKLKEPHDDEDKHDDGIVYHNIDVHELF